MLKEINMSYIDFYCLCCKHCISMEIALEDDELVTLIKNKSTIDEVEKYMEENF